MKPVLSSARVRDALFRLLRAAFRALPVGESTRDTLRQRFLQRFPTVRPIQPKGIAASGFERRPRIHAAERAIGYVERRDEPLPDPLPATLVAFYLPQFHTIPENDEWWGKGFTEWRNVTRALPQFEGHVQPRLPGDLGFYDLRNPQVMRDQAELAEAYGISAFCFYFYWFGGKTLLEDPLKQWLADSSIRLQYCLCWANENWTRRWDGRDSETLVAQTHSPQDDLAFIAYIAPYLRDPRYLRVDGKPLLLLYRPGVLPDVAQTAERWRTWCREHGVGEIMLAYVQSFERPDPSLIGFDAAVAFPPNLGISHSIAARQTLLNPQHGGEVLDWRAMAAGFASTSSTRFPVIPGVNCGWDNEPRRPGNGRTYLHASPRRYGEWLEESIRLAGAARASGAGGLVFINAWNEWAEGAVLEPDARLGHAYLEKTRAALAGSAQRIQRRAHRPCIVLHAWHLDIAAKLISVLDTAFQDARLVCTVPPDRYDDLERLLQHRSVAAEIHVSQNRGRDILPFLDVANRLLDEGEDVVLKLHTKRSPQLANGDAWRDEMTRSLLASGNAHEFMSAFQRESGLGMIVPAGHVLCPGAFAGANQNHVDYLERRTGISWPIGTRAWFPSGSMYWVRLASLRPLLDAHLYPSEFEREGGQLDGTLAHAVERFVGCSVEAAGYFALDSTLQPIAPISSATEYRFVPAR